MLAACRSPGLSTRRIYTCTHTHTHAQAIFVSVFYFVFTHTVTPPYLDDTYACTPNRQPTKRDKYTYMIGYSHAYIHRTWFTTELDGQAHTHAQTQTNFTMPVKREKRLETERTQTAQKQPELVEQEP